MKKSAWLGYTVMVIFVAAIIGLFYFMEMVFDSLIK